MNKEKARQHAPWAVMIALLMITSLACGLLTDTVESLIDVGSEIQDEIQVSEDSLEFLFELIPFGVIESHSRQHTIRWQIFASAVSAADLGDVYAQDSDNWIIEKDEDVNGQRHLVVNSGHPLSAIYSAAEFQRALSDNGSLPAALLDIEVLNMPAHSNIGRLQMIDQQGLPDGTIVILVDYFYQELEPTATPPEVVVETPSTETQDTTCQQAISGSLCNNPYFPPIEGMTLVYQMDDGRIQTREITNVQTGVHAAGEPPMDSFTVTFTDRNIDIDMEFLCTEEGMIGGDVGRMMVAALEGQDMGGETVSVESTTFEGVTLPNNISPGDTWEAYAEVVMSGPEGVKLIATNQASSRFVGYETVSVPAGTFEAQVIITDMDVDVGAMLPEGHYMSLTSVQITTVSYYAECIGMIKSESEFDMLLIDVIMP